MAVKPTDVQDVQENDAVVLLPLARVSLASCIVYIGFCAAYSVQCVSCVQIDHFAKYM